MKFANQRKKFDKLGKKKFNPNVIIKNLINIVSILILKLKPFSDLIKFFLRIHLI